MYLMGILPRSYKIRRLHQPRLVNTRLFIGVLLWAKLYFGVLDVTISQWALSMPLLWGRDW